MEGKRRSNNIRKLIINKSINGAYLNDLDMEIHHGFFVSLNFSKFNDRLLSVCSFFTKLNIENSLNF